MPINDFSTSGTIKIKNADGVLVPFHPKTKIDCIYDAQDGQPFTSILSQMEEDIETAASSGGVKVVYDEVTDENADQYSNESMIVQIEPTVWKLKFNTRLKLNDHYDDDYDFKTIGIPFDLSKENQSYITLTVDWGDGTVEKILGTSTYNMMHTYAEHGVYTVSISSSDWKNTLILASNEITSFVPNHAEYTMQAFKYHLKSIENELPEIKGIYLISGNSYISGTNYSNGTPYYNTARDMFFYCNQLESIPSNLFVNNPNIVNFYNCFSDCNLNEIPEELFSNNTMATNFENCFKSSYHSSNVITNDNSQQITSIPENLFKYNTAATNFAGCFTRCPLTSIPENLFKYNTAATNFTHCFSWITSSVCTVPENLFKYNTAATTFAYCFYETWTQLSYQYASTSGNFTLHIGSSVVANCDSFVTKNTSKTRTVYVPSGSTTQATFNNAASNLGLTIIGE